jgi:hypothetical protein
LGFQKLYGTRHLIVIQKRSKLIHNLCAISWNGTLFTTTLSHPREDGGNHYLVFMGYLCEFQFTFHNEKLGKKNYEGKECVVVIFSPFPIHI